MKEKLKKIYDAMEEEVDLVYIINSSGNEMNFFYLSGAESGLFEGCAALAYPDSLELIVSKLEEESAKKTEKDAIQIFKRRKERDEILKKKLDVDTIGINGKSITYDAYKKLKKLTDAEIVDISEALSKSRMVKTKDEIKRIKRACDIASESAEEIKAHIKEGVIESELSAELTYIMQKKGATEPAFTNICSFGENTAEPHYTAGKRALNKGDYVLLDFGARYKRYVSDTTRTFVFGGAEEKKKEIYQIVQKAQKLGFDKIKPGVKGKDVHNAVKEYIDSTKYKGKFIHGLGHAIGLEVHDGMGFSENSEVVLEENMVITVEPGIYLPGYGGVRIEDDIRVTKDGVEILTSAPREFTEL
ncbi:MAG: Xaa-Pro peptidase family protein [Euryarchaeota archaeon]|nr:Xaa-Pro peptidase family protein [Euryarchaeota archaeon]